MAAAMPRNPSRREAVTHWLAPPKVRIPKADIRSLTAYFKSLGETRLR